MVDAAVGSVNNSHYLTHYLSSSIDIHCAYCISVKNQLLSALLELKSAWFIIRLLQEDMNMMIVPEVDTCKFINYTVSPLYNGLLDHDAQLLTLNDTNLQIQTHYSHIIRNINKHTIEDSWFQTFAMFWIMYLFFWVFPRRQIVICRRFETHCRFHLQRLW
jgi:hypothetical protein